MTRDVARPAGEPQLMTDRYAQTPTGPLAGVRVLDLSSVVVGPYCTELLGDMGADVTKVEPPDGDVSRWIGPRHSEGMSAQFVNLNRNKRCVQLDLKDPRGREALLRLAGDADVFVTNMRRQALGRLGIGFGEIAAVRPDVVYCRIVGFGAESPHRDKPAIDDVIQAMSGIVALQEELTGNPSYVGMALADATCGLIALSGILAALYRRAESGAGEEIEVPMYDAMASFVLSTHMSGTIFNPPLGPPVYPRSVAPNRRPWRTSDGVLCVAPYSDAQWRRFLAIVGREDLLSDARFATVFDRSHHLDELYALVEPLIAQWTTRGLSLELEASDIPYAPVQSTSDVVADVSLWAAGLFQQVSHPTEGTLNLVANPIRFASRPCNLHRLPGRLGQDTRAVLTEAGFDEQEVDALAGEDESTGR